MAELSLLLLLLQCNASASATVADQTNGNWCVMFGTTVKRNDVVSLPNDNITSHCANTAQSTIWQSAISFPRIYAPSIYLCMSLCRWKYSNIHELCRAYFTALDTHERQTECTFRWLSPFPFHAITTTTTTTAPAHFSLIGMECTTEKRILLSNIQLTLSYSTVFFFPSLSSSSNIIDGCALDCRYKKRESEASSIPFGVDNQRATEHRKC